MQLQMSLSEYSQSSYSGVGSRNVIKGHLCATACAYSYSAPEQESQLCQFLYKVL